MFENFDQPTITNDVKTAEQILIDTVNLYNPTLTMLILICNQ